MKQIPLALAVTTLLSTLPATLVQAAEKCPLLPSNENSMDTGRNSAARCLPGRNPLQDQQWHLLNSGQDAFSERGGVTGNDLNLWWAHRIGILGRGINVAVVDDGLAIAHPDLAGNVRPGSKNVVNGSDDPTPRLSAEAHGTSIAGIIAAIDNNIGPLGIAPRVQLQGFNVIATNSMQWQRDWIYALGGSAASADNRVFNQSYGMSNIYPQKVLLSDKQLEHLFQRNTQKAEGAAYIKAAGNGFNDIGIGNYYYWRKGQHPALPFENSNLDPINTSFWNLVVSAMNANGVRASYSSVGSSVFLTAPAGENGETSPALITTDLLGCNMGYNSSNEPSSNRLHDSSPLDPRCDYNAVMNGTSAATPSTVGAMALLMSAYPRMPVRDLRDLLARSATRIDPNQAPVMVHYINRFGQKRQAKALEGWEQNAAGMWFSPSYGFGLIDVNKALKLAATHQPLPPQVLWPWHQEKVRDHDAEIVDAGLPTQSSTRIANPLTVEAVQVLVNLNHQRVSDLLIVLVSPSGTRSVLLNPYNSLVGQAVEMKRTGRVKHAGMRNMRLLSHKFYGEQAQGEWRLEVTDVSRSNREVVKQQLSPEKQFILTEVNNSKPGKLLSWSIRILGH